MSPSPTLLRRCCSTPNGPRQSLRALREPEPAPVMHLPEGTADSAVSTPSSPETSSPTKTPLVVSKPNPGPVCQGTARSSAPLARPMRSLPASLPGSPATPPPTDNSTTPRATHIPGLGNAAAASDPNLRYRPSNEDTATIVPSLHQGSAFFAIYDGHGGTLASQAAADSLHTKLASFLSTPAALSPSAAFRAAYAAVDADLRAAKALYTGATAVTCLVHPSRAGDGRRVITTANVGDARAVLCRGRAPLRLSTDHRAADPVERARVERAGAFVCGRRVNGMLEVSRALGDHSLKSAVVGEPDVRQVVLGEADEFLLLACDGLWDWVSDEEAVEIAWRSFDDGASAQEVARVLVQSAVAAGSTDNISVLCVGFDDLFD